MKKLLQKILERLKKLTTAPSGADVSKPANKVIQKLSETTGQIKNRLLEATKAQLESRGLSSDLGEIFFSPHNRAWIHRVFIGTLSLITCYNLGKTLSYTLALLLSSAPEKIAVPLPIDFSENKNLAYDDILRANLFNASLESAGSLRIKIDENVLCEVADNPTNLPLKLVNTIVLQNALKSLASFQSGSKGIKSFREGEKVDNLAKVDKIERLRVIIKNLQTGTCEFVATKDFMRNNRANNLKVLSPEEGNRVLEKYRKEGIDSDGENVSISKAALNKYLTSIDDILMQARAIQIVNPDGSLAFKITDIVPGSLYSALGLQNDDIIQEINGKKIHSLNEVMNLFGKIQNIEQMQLKITKEDGDERVMDYNIHP